jgi:ribonuclease P/MRP protein subunit POP1
MDIDASATQPSGEKKKTDRIWQIPPSIAKKLLNSSKNLPEMGLPLNTSLLSIRITLTHRGSPKDRARIYGLAVGTPLSQRWKALATPQKNEGEKTRIEVGHEQYPPVPPAEDIIGFVTTGNYSLSNGRPVGVGAVAWKKISDNVWDRWCVVRDVGSDIGRLARWEPVVL